MIRKSLELTILFYFFSSICDVATGNQIISNKTSIGFQTKDGLPNPLSQFYNDSDNVDQHWSDRKQRRERKRQRRLERRQERGRKSNHHRHQRPISFPKDDHLVQNAPGISQNLGHGGTFYHPSMSLSSQKKSEWLENNLTSVWLTLQHLQKDIRQLRRIFRSNTYGRRHKTASTSVPQSETSTPEDCEDGWDDRQSTCKDEHGILCSRNGRCSCGQCICDSPYYGINCQCNDMVCDRVGSVLCGGPGKGQCRCGTCVCRPKFTGNVCECSLSTTGCRKGNEQLCNGKGSCICNRCQCEDGNHGDHCEESIYSATTCERLKPCVLCSAYGKDYPQCEECDVRVEIVDQLESSRETCLMVNLGCILKYTYVHPQKKGEKMVVLVERDTTCQ